MDCVLFDMTRLSPGFRLNRFEVKSVAGRRLKGRSGRTGVARMFRIGYPFLPGEFRITVDFVSCSYTNCNNETPY